MHRLRANDTYRNRTGRLPPDACNQSPGHNPAEAWDSSYVTVNHSLWEKTGWQSLWSPSTQIHSSNSLDKQLSNKDSLQFHENPSIQQRGTEHPQGGQLPEEWEGGESSSSCPAFVLLYNQPITSGGRNPPPRPHLPSRS